MATTGWIDPSNFDFDVENEKIAKKKKLSDFLAQQAMTPEKGQFIRGGDFTGYAGPGLAGMLAQLAEGYISKKTEDDANAAQADLSAKSDAELAKRLGSTPWADRARQAQIASEANDEMTREARRGMPASDSDGQATVDAYAARTAAPTPAPAPLAKQLRNPLVDSRAIPAPGAAPAAKPLAAMLDGGAGRGFVNPPTVDQPQPTPVPNANAPAVSALGAKLDAARAELAAAKASGNRDRFLQAQGAVDTLERQSALAGGASLQPQVVAAPAAQPPLAAALARGQNAPTSTQTPVPAPAATAGPAMGSMQPALQAPAPAAQPAQQPAEPLVTDARSAIEQAAANATPTLTDQIQYLSSIAKTGPTGKLIADAGFKTLFNDKNNEYEFKTVKQGDNEVLVASNKRNPKDSRIVFKGNSGPSTAQQAQGRDNDKFAAEMLGKQSEEQNNLIDAQTQKSRITKGIELINKYGPNGGILSGAYGAIKRAFGDDTANELDMTLKQLAFSDLKSAFGGNPTEGERKAQLDVKASLERGAAPSTAALNTLLGGYERRIKLHQDNVDKYGSFYNQYRTQPDAAGTSGAPAQAKQTFMYSWQK